MTIALVQYHQHDFEPQCFQNAEAPITLELGNVAQGLNHFAQQLRKTSAAQARFALVIQIKTWILNKPTLQTLMAQYLEEVERKQQVLHLDPEGHNESIESLCDQLVFLSAVFEQELALVDQMCFADQQLVLCD
jgi:succinylglutamate desuccinylase